MRASKKTPEQGAVIVELRGVSAGYDERTVLHDVSLTLRARDFLALLGPNGGGKTTLLRVMLGLLPARAGVVRVFGESASVGRLHLGYVPQQLQADRDFPVSVREVVSMGHLGLRLSRGEENRLVDEALDTVELRAVEKRAVGELSGGQVQRVLIARALASRPQALLLDEPAAHLDPRGSGSLYELLHRLNADIAVVLATHDVGVISKYVKSVACVNGALHYHDSNEVTGDMLARAYGGFALVQHTGAHHHHHHSGSVHDF